jgi:hypothetical protein
MLAPRHSRCRALGADATMNQYPHITGSVHAGQKNGWGGRIRTFACRNQNPVP